MAKLKVELNEAGVRELLQSPEMESICLEYANQVRARAGAGYEVSTKVGKTRVNASVGTSDPATVRKDRKNNTLLKALG